MEPPSDKLRAAKSLEAREARLRRAAASLGLAIVKSRHGGYRIVDPQTQATVHNAASGNLTISQAEAFLGNPQGIKSIAVANLNAANDE